jgi:glycosyltransferase involved in cell wall biosynthesis
MNAESIEMSVADRPVGEQTRRIRVVYIVHGVGVGGATLSVLYLIEKLDKSQYEPVVVFLKETPLADRFRAIGAEIVFAPQLSYFGHTTGEALGLFNPRGWMQVVRFIPSIRRTRKLIGDLNADIVHVNSVALAAEVIGARRAGARVVWHVREHVVHGVFGLRRWLHGFVARRWADHVLTIETGAARRMGLSVNVTLVPNFVDLSRFDSTLHAPRTSGESDRPPTVVMLGGIDPIKGTLEFVRACYVLRRTFPDGDFIVAGNDGRSNILPSGIKGWVRRIIRRDAYMNRVMREADGLVRFVGVIDDIPLLISKADVLVFPSTVPHSARPIIEAGAMGVPVVGSELAGVAELIQNGENGLLAKPRDVEGLVVAISAILGDSALAARLGQKGRAIAMERHSADRNVSVIQGIYRSATKTVTHVSTAMKDQAHQIPPAASSGHSPIARGWVVAFISLLNLAMAVYLYEIATVPGRIDKFQDLLDRVIS